jgi:cysteine desulfuration protein SufE
MSGSSDPCMAYLRDTAQLAIVTEYRELESAEDRLTWLMERSPLQGPLPSALCTPEGRMPGCLSGLWIRGELRQGHDPSATLCFFQCASESAVVQGVASVLCDLVSARPAVEVLECAELFATALRLDGLLTATRRRAVATVTGYFCQCARNALASKRPSA